MAPATFGAVVALLLHTTQLGGAHANPHNAVLAAVPSGLPSLARRGGAALESEPTCPQELRAFSEWRCDRFYNDTLDRSLNASAVTQEFTWESSHSCLVLTTHCTVTHPAHNTSILREVWDFRDPCDYSASFNWDYTVSWGPQPNETAPSTTAVSRISGIKFVTLSESVVVPDTTELLPAVDPATPPRVWQLRVHMRDGQLNNSTVGFFVRVEYVEDTMFELMFVSWMHLSHTMQQQKCAMRHPRKQVSYKQYSDSKCQNLSVMVRGYEADGICEAAERIDRRSEITTGRIFSAGLCEGGDLYLLERQFRDIGVCHAYVNTTFDLKRKSYKIPLSRRGQCIPLMNEQSLLLSADACLESEQVCLWNRGSLGGEKKLVATDVFSLDECRSYTHQARYQFRDDHLCGMSWTEDDPEKACYAVVGICSGPRSMWYSKEWSCLLSSTGSLVRKHNGDSLTVALVGLGIVTVLLSVMMITAAWKYNEIQHDLSVARSNVTVQLIDSGNTDGIIMGVPVPNQRQTRPDEDDDCSEGPVIPYPFPTGNPPELQPAATLTPGEGTADAAPAPQDEAVETASEVISDVVMANPLNDLRSRQSSVASAPSLEQTDANHPGPTPGLRRPGVQSKISQVSSASEEERQQGSSPIAAEPSTSL